MIRLKISSASILLESAFCADIDALFAFCVAISAAVCAAFAELSETLAFTVAMFAAVSAEVL